MYREAGQRAGPGAAWRKGEKGPPAGISVTPGQHCPPQGFRNPESSPQNPETRNRPWGRSAHSPSGLRAVSLTRCCKPRGWKRRLAGLLPFVPVPMTPGAGGFQETTKAPESVLSMDLSHI